MNRVGMLLERAITGDAKSCFLLACEYERKGEWGDAYFWMRQAALKKHLWALTNLGVYYERGYGTQQDIKKAFVWWKRAATLGSVPAMFNMGFHLLYGDGVRKNYRKAVSYLTQVVAREPLSQAYFLLGQCYEFGWGVQKNKTIAFEVYREAAVLGDANSIWRPGVFSYYGIVC